MGYIKKVGITILILAYTFLFTGCQGISRLNSLQIVAPPVNNKLPIQGTWEFSDYKMVSDVQENHEIIANREKILGEIAAFSDTWAIIGDESCSDASYQIRRVNARDYFLFHRNIDVEELNMENSMVTLVSIISNGALFFDVALIDEGTAIVYMDGCFYWLKKVSEEVDKLHLEDRKDLSQRTNNMEDEDEILRTGLFIGLSSKVSDSSGDEVYGPRSIYRTIWISSNNREIKSILEAADLFVPRRSGFWTLRVRTRKINDYFQDYIDCRTLESVLVNLNELADKNKIPEANIKKDILFVSDDYIALEYSKAKGAISPEGKTSRYMVLPLDDANSEKGIFVSDLAEEGMKDIFYKSAQSHLSSKNMGAHEGLEEIAHEDNFTMARRNGYWTLRGRLDTDSISEKFTIGLSPVGKLINYDELHVSWDTIKEKIPMALDAYTSPNKDLLVVITGNFIMIYSLDDGRISDKPIKKISIKKGESVIMAEWATGDYVAKWEKGFNQLNPYVVND